jgi:hypothetical protein
MTGDLFRRNVQKFDNMDVYNVAEVIAEACEVVLWVPGEVER